MSYFYHNNYDIIKFIEFRQFTIFIGKYNFRENIYDINYILDFDNNAHLEKSLKKLLSHKLIRYL